MVSRKRRKSRHKKAVFVAQKLKLLTLGIILVLFFLGGVRKLTLAWKNGWDYHHQENLFIVDGERSYLLILSPESKEVKSWSFPKTWQLDVFGGLGRYWGQRGRQVCSRRGVWADFRQHPNDGARPAN